MFHNLHRVLSGMLALLMLAVLAMPGVAQAQQPTWLPAFDASTHVYVDPALKNHPTAPIDFRGLSDDIKDLQKAHGLQVYIVATQSPYDINRPGPAPTYVNSVQASWSGRPGFPHNDALIIVWVRNTDNTQKMSVAAYSGSKLVSYGFDHNAWTSPSGPLVTGARQHMPGNPYGGLVQIVKNVNGRIDQTIASRAQAERDRVARAEQAERDRVARAEQAERDRIANAEQAERDRIAAQQRAIEDAENAKQMQFYAMVGIPSALVIGLLIFLTFTFRRKKAAAKEILETRRTELQNAGHWYVQLEEAYLGFLKRQTDWQKRFDPKGKTAKEFGEAIKWYAELTTRKLAAADMFARAETEFNGARWPMWSGLDKAVAILSTEEVTVSDKVLSIEEADLFKGLVEEKKYAPADLLANMEELFKKTNTALAKIKKAMEGSEQNRKDIVELLKKVDELKAKLPESKLTFDPYQTRYDVIAKERDDALAKVDADPLAAFEGTEKVERDIEALCADMEKAIEIKAQLVGTEDEIESAEARIVEVRGQKTGYAYPAAEKGKTVEVPADAKEKFLLTESGNNPDDNTAKAREHLGKAHTAVTAGRLAEAQEEKSRASEAAAAAKAVVEKVLAAKKYVEGFVPTARANYKSLGTEIPGAEDSVTALKKEFLEKNYAGQPAKVTTATTTDKATPAKFDAVQVAYFKQDFVSAKEQIDAANASVQYARTGLSEIHARLRELRNLREHAKRVTAENSTNAGTLKSKLETEKFTTSAATDRAYAALVPTLNAQKADVAKDITDWPVAAQAADKMAADLKSVDTAIDNEKQAYAHAGRRIDAVSAAIDEAARVVEHDDVRQPARSKLNDARQVLAELKASYRVAKSDWKALASQADSKLTVANEAKSLAEADRRLAREVRSEIDTVETRIESLRTRSWFQTASWGGYSQVLTIPIQLDLSTANSYVRQANGELRQRNYEGAREYIRRADSAADSAEQWANQQLALAIQEQIRKWQEIEAEKERQRQEEQRRRDEERRRKEEEDRRRREEEDRNRPPSGGFDPSPPSGGFDSSPPPSGGTDI